MRTGVAVPAGVAAGIFAEACAGAFDPDGAWARFLALVDELSVPAAEIADMAAEGQDGCVIRRAAWLVEFLEVFEAGNGAA